MEDSRDGTRINPNLCHVKKSFIYKEIHEDIAVNKLQSKKLITLKDESILLDIDEDYYGCAYASKPLLDSNMTRDMLEHISDIVKKLVCVRDGAEEKYADSFLTSALSALRKAGCSRGVITQINKPLVKQKSSKQNSVLFDSKKGNEVDNSKKGTKMNCVDKIKEVIYILKKNLFLPPRGKLACLKFDFVSEKLLRDLVELFSKLTAKQQKALQYVGFCMSNTHKNTKVLDEFYFKICYGMNMPWDSSVNIHIPTLEEINKRTLKLNSILSKIRKPKLVTVCRSVRDGYTPRKFFNKIENDVMKSLNSTYKRLRVHYDSDLLGGKRGWTNRRRQYG